jgi:hypothetical protein
MEEPVYTEERHGLRIEIVPDFDPQQPIEDDDDNVALVAFHRDFWIERKGFEKEICAEMYVDPKHSLRKLYHVFAIEAYIHGGVAIALSSEGNFPDRRWDVSNPVGFIFIAKKEWRTHAKAEKYARGLIESYNDYLSGNVYGFIVDPDGVNESVWGYYGDYDSPGGALAEARSTADYIFDEARKKHLQRLKAYILNHVPLERRQPMTV